MHPGFTALGFSPLALRPVSNSIRHLIGHFWGDKLLAAIDRAAAGRRRINYPGRDLGIGPANRRRPLGTTSGCDRDRFWSPSPLGLAGDRLASGPQPEDRRTGGIRRRACASDGIPDVCSISRYRSTSAELKSNSASRRTAFIPLIVGGSWGVGDIVGSTAAAVAAGAFPVVVTAGNAELKATLDARYPNGDECSHPRMVRLPAGLMISADCLIQMLAGSLVSKHWGSISRSYLSILSQDTGSTTQP